MFAKILREKNFYTFIFTMNILLPLVMIIKIVIYLISKSGCKQLANSFLFESFEVDSLILKMF